MPDSPRGRMICQQQALSSPSNQQPGAALLDNTPNQTNQRAFVKSTNGHCFVATTRSACLAALPPLVIWAIANHLVTEANRGNSEEILTETNSDDGDYEDVDDGEVRGDCASDDSDDDDNDSSRRDGSLRLRSLLSLASSCRGLWTLLAATPRIITDVPFSMPFLLKAQLCLLTGSQAQSRSRSQSITDRFTHATASALCRASRFPACAESVFKTLAHSTSSLRPPSNREVASLMSLSSLLDYARSIHSQGMSALEVAASCGNLAACRVLVEECAVPIRSAPTARWDALNLACRGNHADVAEFLLSRGADPRWSSSLRPNGHPGDPVGQRSAMLRGLDERFCRDHSLEKPSHVGMTALHWAAHHGNLVLCRKLVVEGSADPDAINRLDGRTPLQIAAFRGHVDVIEFLGREAGANPNLPPAVPPDVPWNMGMHPLCSAVAGGNLGACVALVHLGASAIVARHENRSLLNVAIGTNAPLEVVTWTLQVLPREIVTAKRFGNLAIHTAAIAGRADIVEALLATGDPFLPDAVNDEGLTCAHLAAENNWTEVLEVLIRAGAAVHVGTATVSPPLITALEHNHRDICKLILQHRPDASHGISISKQSTLSWATVRGDVELAALLLDAGAPLDEANVNGDTVLDYAIEHNHLNVLELILDRRPDAVHLIDRDRCSPLGVAASKGRLDACRLLLARGAPVDVPHHTGPAVFVWPPLFKAVVHGKTDVLALLLTAHTTYPCVLPAATEQPPSSSSTDHQRPPPDLRRHPRLAPLLAAAAQQADAVTLCAQLLAAGAPLDERDETRGGATALHFAAAVAVGGGGDGGDDEDPLVALLADAHLSRRVTIDGRASRGRTPLHVAAVVGAAGAARALVRRGADVGAVDADGETPVALARGRGWGAVVGVLERAAAAVGAVGEAGEGNGEDGWETDEGEEGEVGDASVGVS
ncbi:ankyrin repeat-containing domain protein [Zopfochytrium polystomum]|nr:ankyrin repeat-containing domain protein [Zopfochytrium polystomum]